MLSKSPIIKDHTVDSIELETHTHDEVSDVSTLSSKTGSKNCSVVTSNK